MESILAFFTLFSLLLFASTIDARKDLGEYWKVSMKGQSMPEAIQGLIGTNPISSVSNEKTDCHDEHKEKKSYVKDFERDHTNVFRYKDDVKPTEEKSFDKDFKPDPNFFFYYKDDVKPTGEQKSFVKEFEPMPNISVNHDDAALN